MNEALLKTIGHNLVAVGLYTVAFESMSLSFRAEMQGYLLKNDPESLPEFRKACKTAERTVDFCEPRMVQFGVLDQAEVDALVGIRRRRNTMAHEGYNQMLNLTVNDIEEDVALMLAISRKVERWCQAVRELNADGSLSFSIAPSIFGLYLSAAQELARTKFNAIGSSV